MQAPTIFISYSHKDEKEKEALLAHLGVLGHTGLIELWNDDRIRAGADWEQEIKQAIARASVAILLISANFLTSDFILGREVPELLKRHETEGLVVFPVIARSCAWRAVDWLARMNVRPKNGEPVWGGRRSHVDEDLTAIAEEIERIIKQKSDAQRLLKNPPVLPKGEAPKKKEVTYPSRSVPNIQPNRILIVTVTKVEAQAILEVFSHAAGANWTRQLMGNKTYYNLGTHGGALVFMVQSEMGSATPGGAMLTVRQAVQDLRPQAVIMCGVAFGLRPDSQQLGDILVARQLQSYEPQKIDLQRGQMPRGDRTTSAERLLDRFRSGDLDWRGAQTHFGLVLSGEKLINDPTFRDWLLKIEPEAVGGEMEGAGLYVAARDARVDWILVKGICDWADGKKNSDIQPQAARNAAQFVLHVLQLGGWSESEQL